MQGNNLSYGDNLGCSEVEIRKEPKTTVELREKQEHKGRYYAGNLLLPDSAQKQNPAKQIYRIFCSFLDFICYEWNFIFNEKIRLGHKAGGIKIH